MVISSHPSYQYQIGACLAHNAPSYIVRQADSDFYKTLKAGQFCYVFNSRQMGKSSLRVQTMQTLIGEGIACANIIMTSIVTHDLTSDSFYATIIQSLADEFDISFKLSSWWRERELLSPLQRMSEFIEEILLKEITENIVIFIDEIDSLLNLNFPNDDFFAFIRSCYEQRVDKPVYQRLTFALLGVATPSVLIQDRGRTPFNLGYAIQLNGFQEQEALPLAKGLLDFASNPKTLLKEILFWTGGQPFLTQKLCKLVVDNGEVIPRESEAKFMEYLVQKKVIKNWQDRDHPQHLKTIEDRILQSNQKAHLLGIYQQILAKGEVTADDSAEQMELRLSGLVVKQQGKLKVYNRIYDAVFNKNWLIKELSKLRPYGEAMTQWIASGSQEKSWLLRGKALQESLNWAKKNAFTNSQDWDYLNTCQDRENRRLRIKKFVQFFLIFCGLIAGSIGLGKAVERYIKEAAFAQRISSGEKILTLPKRPPDVSLKAGVEAFAQKDFQEAVEHLKIARKRDINDPEVLIYLNNAQVGSAPAYTIGVSLPLNTNLNIAQEILRGVAQAQDEINRQGGIKGKLLKVKIASDDNDPEIAKQVATKFVQDSDIIAVVGHNASKVSIPVVPMYERGEVVMISPTSYSNELSKMGQYIFRTVPSIRYFTDGLAKYAVEIHKSNLVVCEDFRIGEIHYQAELQIALSKYGGKVIFVDCELANPNLDPDFVIKQALKQGADSLFLGPYIDSIQEAIKIAEANQNQLKLFASASLYTHETLQSGRSAVKGMVLTVPWIPDSNLEFSNKAIQYWGGNVNWRTATSYDATLAIIEGLKQSDGTRKGLQKALANPLFKVKGATGIVKFLATGDRICIGILVKVQPGKKSGTGYDFVPLNTSK